MKTSTFNGMNISQLPFNYQFTYNIYGSYSIDTILNNYCERLFNKCKSIEQMFAIAEYSKLYAQWNHTHILVVANSFNSLTNDLQKAIKTIQIISKEDRCLTMKQNSKSIIGFKDEWVDTDTLTMIGKKEKITLQKINGIKNFALYANKYNDNGIHNNYWKK